MTPLCLLTNMYLELALVFVMMGREPWRESGDAPGRTPDIHPSGCTPMIYPPLSAPLIYSTLGCTPNLCISHLINTPLLSFPYHHQLSQNCGVMGTKKKPHISLLSSVLFFHVLSMDHHQRTGVDSFVSLQQPS